jgi:ketosteroid isomerase-like protein
MARQEATMQASDVPELVRRSYATFQARDREAMEGLLTDDFTFSSPDDPDLDKAAFFERCWPNGDHHQEFEIEKLFDRGDEAFVRYRIRRDTGEEFRNTEYLKVKDGQIARVEVYYGT